MAVGVPPQNPLRKFTDPYIGMMGSDRDLATSLDSANTHLESLDRNPGRMSVTIPSICPFVVHPIFSSTSSRPSFRQLFMPSWLLRPTPSSVLPSFLYTVLFPFFSLSSSLVLFSFFLLSIHQFHIPSRACRR